MTFRHPKVASQKSQMKNTLMALTCASTLVAALRKKRTCPTSTVAALTHVATQDVSAILEWVENVAEQNAALRAELEGLNNEENSDLRPTARPNGNSMPPASEVDPII